MIYNTAIDFYCREGFIHITDTNAATVFWVPKSDRSYYSSTVVYYYSDKFLIRAAIPDTNATKCGFRSTWHDFIAVDHEGKRYKLHEFEVRKSCCY